MALAVKVFARRFAFLLTDLGLLLPDPTELGDGKHADAIKVHAKGGGDAYLASGRVNAQVDVLDVLLDYLYRLRRCRGSFAFLLTDLGLLLPDPTELGDGKHADAIKVHAKGGGDAYLASGRVKAQVDVLDVLLDYLYRLRRCRGRGRRVGGCMRPCRCF